MELPKGNTELSRDARPIKCVCWPNGEEVGVGRGPVTAIEAYDESGHMACIPWIAVFNGDQITMRIPAEQVTVVYE